MRWQASVTSLPSDQLADKLEEMFSASNPGVSDEAQGQFDEAKKLVVSLASKLSNDGPMFASAWGYDSQGEEDDPSEVTVRVGNHEAK